MCGSGNKCLTCKIVGLVIMVLTALLTLVSLYAAYRMLFVLENRIGTTDGSLVIIAAIFSMGAMKKGMKMCPCRSKGCGCGCGSGCGGDCHCGDKQDNKMAMPHQH